MDMLKKRAKYHIGQVVRHRKHPFRGVIFDVDAIFSNTEEWYDAIPEESRPSKEQPFYHLLAENDENYYVAYVSAIRSSSSSTEKAERRFNSRARSRPCAGRTRRSARLLPHR